MLKVKLGKALAFLPYTDIDIDRAFSSLFGEIDPSQSDVSESILRSLSNEWLLFDFRPQSGRTLIEQYYFQNPDVLSKAELQELQQIIETQSTHLLQPYSKSEPPYVFLQSIFSGKKFKVFDQKLSLSIDKLQGSFLGRIATVDRTQLLVGSDPVVFPVRYTPRAIALFAKEKTPSPTLGETIRQLVAPKKPFEKIVNIKSKRKELQKRYSRLSKDYPSKVTFKMIVDFVYQENYQHHFADYVHDLIKLGVPEKLCIQHLDFVHEIWNYFPHKILGKKCPHELYKNDFFESS